MSLGTNSPKVRTRAPSANLNRNNICCNMTEVNQRMRNKRQKPINTPQDSVNGQAYSRSLMLFLGPFMYWCLG
jgi:hypothetical protein